MSGRVGCGWVRVCTIVALLHLYHHCHMHSTAHLCVYYIFRYGVLGCFLRYSQNVSIAIRSYCIHTYSQKFPFKHPILSTFIEHYITLIYSYKMKELLYSTGKTRYALLRAQH